MIDFGNLFQMAGVALLITLGSKLFEKFWKKNRADVSQKLNAIDEQIETKTGYEWPIEIHLIYDRLVKTIISGVDHIANPVIFRRITRAILALVNPATRSALLGEYLDVVKGKAKETISEELKNIINREKLTTAVEAVGAEVSISLPPKFAVSRNIKADVEAAVTALKQENPKEVSTEEINNRIAATRAKLNASLHK